MCAKTKELFELLKYPLNIEGRKITKLTLVIDINDAPRMTCEEVVMNDDGSESFIGVETEEFQL